MTEEERDEGTWIGGLMDAAARGYEPDDERLRDLVSSRIAERDGSRTTLRRFARRPPSGAGLRIRLNRTFSAGAGIAVVATAVAIAVGITAMLAVTSPGATANGAAVISASGTTPALSPSTHATAAAPSTLAATAATAGATTDASLPAVSSDSYTATESIDGSSNPEWTQLDVVVTAKEPLTALEITIKVADCAGLGMAKSYDNGAYGAFTTSTTTAAADGSVTYVFRLVAGQTFVPGTVEFAAQFNHGETGWRPGDDTYRISARPASASTATVTDGGF